MAREGQGDIGQGLLLGALSLLAWQCWQLWSSKSKFEEAYWGERRGRARVEKEMRKISNIRLDTSQGFYVQPIGEISSCYRQCVGTPRQGLLVPSSRATIKLTSNISSEAIEGLQECSHVWITFKFHLNTNTLKESKAFSNRSTFNGKITLPMLKRKLGVFATRSPHRPNPIGITLAKVDRIDKKKHLIYLNGCDLVQGTPVFDVKVIRHISLRFFFPLSRFPCIRRSDSFLCALVSPLFQPYVPAYDTVPSYKIPSWIENTVYSRNTVTFLPQAIDKIRKIQGRLKQFHNEADAYLLALRETLEVEVRSKFQTAKQMEFTAKGLPVNVLFDETIVKYFWRSEREFEVVDIVLVSEDRELVKELMKVQLGDSEEGGETDDGRTTTATPPTGESTPEGAEGAKSIYEIDLSQYARAP